MKQKIVIKVSMNHPIPRFFCFRPQNPHSKVLKLAGGFKGVQSVALVRDQDRIEVTGDIDAVNLATLLRKKVGFTEIVQVSKADEKEKKESESKNKAAQPIMWPYISGVPHREIPYVMDPYPSYSEPPCSIM
ncbi:hypothetical protein BT93_L1714 [Corymbia citriodora subsp. variegata]|uniref:HMA domain-containing protein n=1 Tax=Corymbia citriodora subsp. variegata TaxID=360336 RepID=A0A8T0CLZ0_CORYI|nr:hypothetical protein BT93_L1714 [Corymbia citriodora subsp. variegata]